MQLHGWRIPAVCNHPYKYCGSGDTMFQICHMTFDEHIFKGLCEFMRVEDPHCEYRP